MTVTKKLKIQSKPGRTFKRLDTVARASYCSPLLSCASSSQPDAYYYFLVGDCSRCWAKGPQGLLKLRYRDSGHAYWQQVSRSTESTAEVQQPVCDSGPVQLNFFRIVNALPLMARSKRSNPPALLLCWITSWVGVLGCRFQKNNRPR
jgi:hypothetical protein